MNRAKRKMGKNKDLKNEHARMTFWKRGVEEKIIK